ncbi:Gluconate 2-dehydrogenase subunit 3 [Pedobacter sp. ok626]|uniref:gluconate 2-dehydrogenase subunit 3 family protein n=1 Tax=Pedobacter sp. ok626 TaxID=1761882 RepID=UPI0008850B8E|nr:gluconate 2-dehydrogenase subunit 3 family protein [Pedobacter sp. ok626]SDJ56939.1 Gluconate 2-dehydrogenase subunit 3 [Pedobacter sp. ok626]
MNRRTLIKGIAVFSSLGVSSFSLYKWFSLSAKPDFRTLHHMQGLIAELAEVIIPRTDTPGAKDAMVDVFIVDMIKSCTDVKTQNNFIVGLNELKNYTLNNYHTSFSDCSINDKFAILKHFEKKSTYHFDSLNKIDRKFLGLPFFIKLKQLTVEGYCISQIGATTGLVYDYIPHSFQACIPLTKDQRSWATK